MYFNTLKTVASKQKSQSRDIKSKIKNATVTFSLFFLIVLEFRISKSLRKKICIN
jgi:hypothetical protein